MAERFVASADARVFLGRLTHLDPAALVRLRPAGGGRTSLWARLPWGVLVTREVDGEAPGDRTVGARDLLASGPVGQLPAAQDAQWRWPLPSGPLVVVEQLPASTLRQVAAAAAGTLKEVSARGLAGRAVGPRVLREALLDHVPIVASGVSDGEPVQVPQRLVQAVMKMGFLGPDAAAAAGPDDAPVRVCRVERWVGLAARFGTAWWAPPAGPLALRPV